MTDDRAPSFRVAALFVDPAGPYVGLDGVDPWDEAKDARAYPGRTKAEARALRSDPRWKAAERLSKNQRLHTPPAFRDALLELARLNA